MIFYLKKFRILCIFSCIILLTSCNNQMIQAIKDKVNTTKQSDNTKQKNTDNKINTNDNTTKATLKIGTSFDIGNIGVNITTVKENITDLFNNDSDDKPKAAKIDMIDKNILAALPKESREFIWEKNDYMGYDEQTLKDIFGDADFIANDNITKIYQYHSQQCTIAFYFREKEKNYIINYIDVRHRDHYEKLSTEDRKNCAKLTLAYRYNKAVS